MLPADAGMIRVKAAFTGVLMGAPRRRGDDPSATGGSIDIKMCSPQTRG